MKVSMFECWFCEKPLLGKGKKTTLQKYAFWCGKRCHDKYVEASEASGADSKAWSDYMSDEGDCPDHMQHLIPVIEEVFFKKDKPKKGKKKVLSAGRTCGKCGKKGHNARTCGKTKKKPTKKHSSIKIKKKSAHKPHQCGVCGGFGHNARTCSGA